MNGLQLQSHLAIEGWSIPIIFISAYGNKQVRRKAMQAGAVAFLEKPLERSNCSKLFGQHWRKTTEDKATCEV